MKRQYTCTYANCRKTDVPIVITMPMERARFCCYEHAAMAMIRRARIQHRENTFADRDHPLTKWEILGLEVVGDGK